MTKGAIDFEHLKTYTAGDEGIEREVLGMFAHQVEMWMRLLQDSSDAEGWRDAAHSLKGSARGIGAWKVARLCEHAETLVDGDATAERSIALGDIREAIAEVISCINDRLAEKSVA